MRCNVRFCGAEFSIDVIVNFVMTAPSYYLNTLRTVILILNLNFKMFHDYC